MFVAILDGTTVAKVGDYRVLFPNVSFPAAGPSAEWMKENNCLGVTVFKPHDQRTEKLVGVPPYLEDNQVFTVVVEPKTPEELECDNQSKSEKVRAERNARLAETDWRFRIDMNPSQEWRDYCQALRDLTSQSGFPWAVQWPLEPQ